MIFRVITACWGIPVLLFLVYAGNLWLLLLLSVLILCSTYEFSVMMKNNNHKMPYITFLVSFIVFFGNIFGFLSLSVFLSMLILFLWSIIFFNRYTLFDICLSFVCIFFISFSLSFFYLIRNLDNGFFWSVTLLTSLWLGDSMAYIVGKNFGKHKLSDVSPKKTWEGALANMVFGIIPFMVLSTFLQKSIFLLIFLGIIVNIVSQISDLSESLIKRIFCQGMEVFLIDLIVYFSLRQFYIL
ncbi:MAG: hypothetical protein C0174_06550 [Thermodesulfobium narugense]|nr:MAG: hypothetical protein C0174_06550 [Thermodesulfobium narugense]